MQQLIKNRNFYIMLWADIVLFVVSLLLAYNVRFNFEIPAAEWRRLIWVVHWTVAIKALVFMLTGVYRGMWRFTSIRDGWRVANASALATLLIIAALTLGYHFDGFPRSVYLTDCIFTIFLCGSFRLGIRLFYMPNYHSLFFPFLRLQPDDNKTEKIRLLLVGAGNAANMLLREIQSNANSPYKVVCCVDDDESKIGRTLMGLPVYGPLACLSALVDNFNIREILITMPSVSGNNLRRIISLCKATGIPFKTLPSLGSLIDGRITVNELREVKYEDLLGRPPVSLNLDKIGSYLTGKTVAVTGAGGSIGSELCRQIMRFHPAALVLIESSEFSLYQIEKTLRIEHKFDALHPAMSRVQNHALMTRIFERYRPQVVFHAAACKHVPMVELNPWEAVINNIVGSQVVMDVAEASGVERCVMVSTDKAVRPTNVMGASKRAVEILMQSRPVTSTRFMAVRFGNVIGSSGSAIPLFQSQIKAGGPVTVTDPEMTRYFMTITEAAQLILQAGAMGEGGEIFILEMGTAVNIADMARDLIRLSGKEPDRDIEITYIGLRPGEKLYEELITHGEGIVPTDHEKIMVLRRTGSLAYTAQCYSDISAQVSELVQAAQSFDCARIQLLLKRLAPEYTPSGIPGFLHPAQPKASEPGDRKPGN